MKIYFNGELNKSDSSWAGRTIHYDTNALVVGGVPGWWFSGRMDEVRISSAARSARWVNISYLNQNDPSAFYSIGAEEIG